MATTKENLEQSIMNTLKKILLNPDTVVKDRSTMAQRKLSAFSKDGKVIFTVFATDKDNTEFIATMGKSEKDMGLSKEQVDKLRFLIETTLRKQEAKRRAEESKKLQSQKDARNKETLVYLEQFVVRS